MSGRSPWPSEVRDAAVSAVNELSARTRSKQQAMELVAHRLGVSVGTIRNWVNASDPERVLAGVPTAALDDAVRIVDDLLSVVAAAPDHTAQGDLGTSTGGPPCAPRE